MLVAAGGRRHPIEQVFRIMDATTREPAPNPMALAIRHNKTMGLTANCVLIGAMEERSPSRIPPRPSMTAEDR